MTKTVMVEAMATFKFSIATEMVIQRASAMKRIGGNGYNGTRKGRLVLGSRCLKIKTPATVAPMMMVNGRPM